MRIIACHYCDGTGAVLDTAEAPTPVAAAPRAELPPPMPQRPAAPEEPPLPPWQGTVGPGQYAQPPSQSPGVPAGACSQGHPWKVVPAGYSEKKGKNYSAFTVCDDRDHGERPR